MTGPLSRPRRLGAWMAALAFLGVTVTVAQTQAEPAAGSQGSKGHVRVFAHIGSPGYPALTLVSRHRVYVSTFTGVNGGTPGPSKVFAYSRKGNLERTYVIRGQKPGNNHAVQVATHDRHGRLYLLDQTPPRIIRLNPRSGKQHTWATFADVPTCRAAGRDTGCSNTTTDNPPEPDYAAWLPDGSMIVTDYAQQLIWRVPPGGGKAKVWINDARLDGEMFGPAGIVLTPSHRTLLVTVAAGGVTTSGAKHDTTTGKLYRIRLDRAFHPTRLQELWSSGRAEAPDGFALSRSGSVYVALSGPSGNTLAELARTATGHWHKVWQEPAATTVSGPVPWDTPTSAEFMGRHILVTNQGYFSGDTSHMVVFSVRVNQRPAPIYVPRSAGRR